MVVIAATTTAEQHDEEPRKNWGMKGVEGGEEQDVKSEGELQEEGTEAQEMRDTKEQKQIEGTQSEVRVPTPPYTSRTALGTMLHEHAQFNCATEVNEELGANTVQPDPSGATTNIVRTRFTKPVPTDPAPIDPIPNDVAVDPTHVQSLVPYPLTPFPLTPIL